MVPLMNGSKASCSGICSEFRDPEDVLTLKKLKFSMDAFYEKFPPKEAPRKIFMASSTLDWMIKEFDMTGSQNTFHIEHSFLHGIPIFIEESLSFGTYVIEYMDGSQKGVKMEGMPLDR